MDHQSGPTARLLDNLKWLNMTDLLCTLSAFDFIVGSSLHSGLMLCNIVCTHKK